MCAGPRQPRRTSHLSSGPLRLPALAPPRQERSSTGGPSSAWMLGWSGPRPRRAPAASARPARGRAAPRRTAAFSRRCAPSPPRRSGPPAAARASPVRQASLRTDEKKTPKGSCTYCRAVLRRPAQRRGAASRRQVDVRPMLEQRAGDLHVTPSYSGVKRRRAALVELIQIEVLRRDIREHRLHGGAVLRLDGGVEGGPPGGGGRHPTPSPTARSASAPSSSAGWSA